MKTHHVCLLVCVVALAIAIWQYCVGQQDLSNIFCIVTVAYGFGAWRNWGRV